MSYRTVRNRFVCFFTAALVIGVCLPTVLAGVGEATYTDGDYDNWSLERGPLTDGTSLTNGLVAYYPLDGHARDETGNGYDGTLYGPTATTNRNEIGRAHV